MSESNPLVQRVDALLKRHQQQAGMGTAAPVQAEPQAVEDSALPFVLADEMASATPRFDGESAPASSPPSQPADPDDDIPVLTEIVDPLAVPGALPPGRALVDEIEAAVMGKVLAELDLSLDRHLNRTIGETVERAMDGLRADLADHVRRVVHEAVAAALTKGDTDDGGRS